MPLHPLVSLVQQLQQSRQKPSFDRNLIDNGIFVQGGPSVSPMANYYGTGGDPMEHNPANHILQAMDLQGMLDKPDPDEEKKQAAIHKFIQGLKTQTDPVQQILAYLASKQKEKQK